MATIYTFFLADVYVNDRLILESDFPMYYAAATIVKDGLGEKLYEIELQSEYQDMALYPIKRGEPRIFKYLPLTTLIFSPLTLFSHNLAYRIFMVVNILFTILAMVIGTKLYPNLKRQKIYWVLPLAFYPFSLSLAKGQVSIMLLVILLMVVKYIKKRDFRSGAYYSLILLKPQFFVSGYLFFLIISNKKREFVKGSGMGALLIFLLSSLISGSKWLWNYMDKVIINNSMHGSVLEEMFNLRNLITHLVADSTTSYLVLAIVFMFTLFAF